MFHVEGEPFALEQLDERGGHERGEHGQALAGSEPIDATTMLPAEFGSFRYAGSLTTPPCSEVVTWNVFADPVYLSESQIQTYRDHYENNYRPVQSLYRRLVLAEGISE